MVTQVIKESVQNKMTLCGDSGDHGECTEQNLQD
jgi:hypothetical protein